MESYYYTTLTFSVQSAGTDDDLKSELIGAGAAVGLDVAKIEVTSSPDDGRKVRLRRDQCEFFPGKVFVPQWLGERITEKQGRM